MVDKDWDKNLRDLLDNHKPEGILPDWEVFSSHMEQADINDPDHDPAFDDSLKEPLSTYLESKQAEGWQRIQASLDAADKKFDETIRKRIADFEPHYDPRTWPLFIQRLADSKSLTAKLIVVKVFEVAAVLLILLTVLNMERMGKLPFENPLYNDQKDNQQIHSAINPMAQNLSPKTTNEPSTQSEAVSITGKNHPNSVNKESVSSGNHNSKTRVIHKSPGIASSPALSTRPLQVNSPTTLNTGIKIKEVALPFAGIDESILVNNLIPVPSEGSSLEDMEDGLIVSAEENNEDGSQNFLSTLTTPVSYDHYTKVPYPNYVKERKRAYTEFGILAQVDYDQLRMPEDRLYSTGRQIIFPQQGLPSYGYGGGFTIASAHPRWAVESGLIYNAKTFEPGRKLAVGTAFDNGIIEFEAMRLQMVTIPLQIRYKVTRTGPLKFFAFAGFGLNMIVQSDVDVTIKYHFPSLSIGENPNNNPNLANTIKESRRVSEHIRDGAPFSSKSYVTTTTGIGLEYSIAEHKTFFLQTAFQYQIPDLEFSNNNGKHIRSISVQAGVRTPLMK